MNRRVVQRHWWPAMLLLALIAMAATFAPAPLLRGYLLAYLSALNLALGSLTILLIASLSGAHWVNWLTTPLRAATATLPALALLTLPLYLHPELIWPWAVAADTTTASPAERWLQPPWPIVRSLALWATWLGIAGALGVWRLREPLALHTLRASLSLIVLLPGISLFAVDWIMALVSHHKTSMIGFLLVSEQWVATLAMGALWLCSRRQFRAQAGRDVGNLLLAAVMFFGYCLFMDYLITWEANLPHDIIGYLERQWQLLAASLPLMVVLPIALLLFRDIKTRTLGLGSVATLALAGHLLVVAWWLSPLFHGPDGDTLWSAADTLAAAMIAAAWLWLFLALARRVGPGEDRTEDAA